MERMMAIKRSSQEARLIHLKGILSFAKTSEEASPSMADTGLMDIKDPILLCGESSLGETILELHPLKTIKLWYGGKSLEKRAVIPDEKWPFLIRNSQIQSENESLSSGKLFQDEQDIYLIGPKVRLSSAFCLTH